MEILENKIESIQSLTEAVALTVEASGISPNELADKLGVEVGHLNRILNKHDCQHFPPDLLVPLMTLCKNLLPVEWLAWQMGYRLYEKSLTPVLKAIKVAIEEEALQDDRPLKIFPQRNTRSD